MLVEKLNLFYHSFSVKTSSRFIKMSVTCISNIVSQFGIFPFKLNFSRWFEQICISYEANALSEQDKTLLVDLILNNLDCTELCTSSPVVTWITNLKKVKQIINNQHASVSTEQQPNYFFTPPKIYVADKNDTSFNHKIWIFSQCNNKSLLSKDIWQKFIKSEPNALFMENLLTMDDLSNHFKMISEHIEGNEHHFTIYLQNFIAYNKMCFNERIFHMKYDDVFNTWNTFVNSTMFKNHENELSQQKKIVEHVTKKALTYNKEALRFFRQLEQLKRNIIRNENLHATERTLKYHCKNYINKTSPMTKKHMSIVWEEFIKTDEYMNFAERRIHRKTKKICVKELTTQLGEQQDELSNEEVANFLKDVDLT